MYQEHFGMTQRPFAATPHLGAYFPSTDSEEAIATLRYCITQGRGIALLTGGLGTGKTMICHRLASKLVPAYTTAMIAHTNLNTPKALLQAILYDLALPYRGMDEQELRLTLTDFLLGRYAGGGRTVVIIDEAQNLSKESLEEIRLLGNLEDELDKLIHIVLVGQPRLVEMLRHSDSEALNQRIGGRATIGPLNEQDTVGYIEAQLRSAGVETEKLFTHDAMAAVYEATAGIPRLINQLCEHALMLAYVTEASRVSGETVEQAQADLNRMAGESQSPDRIDHKIQSPIAGLRQTLGHGPQQDNPAEQPMPDEEIVVDPYAAMDEARRRPAEPAGASSGSPRPAPASNPVAEQTDVKLGQLIPEKLPSEPRASIQRLPEEQVVSVQLWNADEQPACYEIGADSTEPEPAQEQSNILVLEDRHKRTHQLARPHMKIPELSSGSGATGAYRRLFSNARKEKPGL